MHARRLGSSGLQLSELGLGAWLTFGGQVPRSTARELVATAWDHGVTFFDNAEGYANGEAERVMGDVIADLRLPRDGYAVSSKVFFGSAENPNPMQRGLSRKHVTDACHAALRRLRVDYLDLYFCHRPDPDTPVAETVLAMDALVRQGKVLYWGTSEWSAAQIQAAHAAARELHCIGPGMEQPQYNLLHRERVEHEYAALYRDHGMGTTTFSPLASGLLTGKYADAGAATARLNRPDSAWLQDIVLGDVGQRRAARAAAFARAAREAGVEPAAAAIAWCLRNPHVSSVILGASSVAQLRANLAAPQAVAGLSQADWQRLEDAAA